MNYDDPLQAKPYNSRGTVTHSLLNFKAAIYYSK